MKLFSQRFRWEGEGVDEIGKEKDTGIVRVKVNPKYYRPTEVSHFLLLYIIVFLILILYAIKEMHI